MNSSDVLKLLKDWIPFIIVVIGIPTILWKEKKGWRDHFKEKSDEKKKEISDIISETLSATLSSINSTLNNIKSRVDDLHERMGSSEENMAIVKRGLQTELRSRLRMCSIKYIERNEITVEEKAEFEALYRSYHELGSNGVMDGYYSEVMKLPVKIKE